jgi:uncharacterized protein YdbL (DUF1318 family)
MLSRKSKASLGHCRAKRRVREVLGPEERLRVWRAEMTAEGRASLSREAVRAKASEGLLELDAARPLAIQHLFERVSVARQLHVAGMLLRRAVGRVTVEEALAFTGRDPLFVRTLSGYLTTAEVLAEERQLLERVEGGRAGSNRWVARKNGRSRIRGFGRAKSSRWRLSMSCASVIW